MLLNSQHLISIHPVSDAEEKHMAAVALTPERRILLHPRLSLGDAGKRTCQGCFSPA